ncbi:serine/threonine-protein kinase VRK1-like isoform X1 [Lytechinus variegatus]|uniref:serine/threonine-protein kinase VRK1-like isoform X1 n=1 Tax=Lytechinus variegatus TaxID=7654 RepID=UPI001BB27549|nr:serine/threonine-protein kinase VRK1-like isoform X1 [Lytechinus variegatus]XP_041469729.1 serine/threonine-protein kinase VRK1-like isoform X1 [Lytechinus variegatus]
MPPKGRKRAYKLPETLPEGEVLRDIRKKEWKLGKPIGQGGFGMIYRASENTPGKSKGDGTFVIKIEPHENGPLYTELHFYQRAAQAEEVTKWQKQQKLSHLGVPKLCGFGSHDCQGIKYRFLVMPLFGEDIWKKYLACNKKFTPGIVFALTIQVLDALEYLHEKDYVHADIKSANLLLGYSQKDKNKVFLADYGLVNRYRPDGKHREYKEFPKKGHNGTPEFTSIDAHLGVSPSRRGDIQILGYVMLQWLCTTLPWENKLTDLDYVMKQKIKYSKDVPGLLKACFTSSYPSELKTFLTYAFQMGYDEKPDYNKLRTLCRTVIKREGIKEGSVFDFGSQSSDVPTGSPVISKKRKASSKEREPSQGRKMSKDDEPGPSGAASRAPPKKRSTSAKESEKSPAQSPLKKSHRVTSPAARKKTPAAKKADQNGVSTPSRRVRKIKTKPGKMVASSTQTTPGLEKRAARR